MDDMTTDEALLVADDLHAVPTSGRGALTACVVLARVVRQQHAEIADLRRRLDRALMSLASRVTT